MLDKNISLAEIESFLRTTNPQELEALWKAADETRRKHVGDAVHLRGLVEISNHCARSCGYCGLRVENKKIERYRMSAEDILGCAKLAVQLRYGTLVMQAGEDYGIRTKWLADIIRKVKKETPLAVTLSLGERPFEDLKAWREAGADRYLLRFETSDTALYDSIHPPLPGKTSDRLDILKVLRDLGYQPGGGVMIGIPGQIYASLAKDIDWFRSLDLDMIGVGPFIPHPETPLGAKSAKKKTAEGGQVPNTELMVYKVIALARIVRPDANIPSTTALATINRKNGRELGLARGANIVMPNLTPLKYRTKYEIYPGKACLNETAEVCNSCLGARIGTIGRTIGKGPGGRRDPR